MKNDLRCIRGETNTFSQMAWSWLCEEVSIPSLHDKGKWSFLHYLLQNIAIDFDDSGLDENI